MLKINNKKRNDLIWRRCYAIIVNLKYIQQKI